LSLSSQEEIDLSRIAAHTATACRGIWFASLVVVVTAGPWLFGSWEMWWFWGFTAIIAIGTLFGGLALLLAPKDQRPTLSPHARTALLCSLPLLLYVIIRGWSAPVAVDAERTVLLFLLPATLATTTAWLASPRQSRFLFIALLVNIAAIAAYGRINHMINGSYKILWADGFSQYYLYDRASAPLYCPDHYAGLLEMGLCLSLSLLFSRRTSGLTRLAAALASLLMVAGVLDSKSRGGLLTLAVIAAAALVWGFAQWPRGARWSWRVMVSCLMLLTAAAAIPLVARDSVDRALRYPPLRALHQGDLSGLHAAAQHTARYHMYSAAARAWREAPVLGIGPGMHPHLWPRYAASPDGNRATSTWPTHTNTRNYSYKVHSDWLQLLEEQGLIGLALLILALTALIRALTHQLRRTADATPPSRTFAPPLAALLALTAIAFHSLGDFNLQIPAIGWTLATLIGLGAGHQNTPRPAS
jgi:O-antigen ligase